MTKQTKIVSLTILGWCLVAAIYAFMYVTTVLSIPKLEGYETEWQFQLSMFALFRLPWLVLGLAIIIAIEIQLMGKPIPNPSFKRDA